MKEASLSQTHHEDGKCKAEAENNAIAIGLAQRGRVRHDFCPGIDASPGRLPRNVAFKMSPYAGKLSKSGDRGRESVDM